MANPQAYTYAAAGTRTVLQKGDIADLIISLNVEDLQMLSRLPRRGTKDTNPKILEDSLAAGDLTNYHAQNSPAPAAVSSARTTNENETQILKKTVQVSNTQQAIAQYGMGQEFDYQMMKKMREIARDAEFFLLSDQAMQRPTPANGNLGKMAGMSALIATNTNLVANFNQANFEALVLAATATSGGNPTQVWMDATRKIAAAGWTEEVTRFSNVAKSMITEVVQYNTKFGFDCQFHWHKHMPQNLVGNAAVCMGLDLSPDLWVIKELIPLKREAIAYTGAGPAEQIMWQFTVLAGGEQASFGFIG